MSLFLGSFKNRHPNHICNNDDIIIMVIINIKYQSKQNNNDNDDNDNDNDGNNTYNVSIKTEYSSLAE